MGRSTIVSVDGEVDIATSAQLSEALGAALRLDAKELVCDLSSVSFFGASVLMALQVSRA
jgi:anti-anti-sigma regulatory factor